MKHFCSFITWNPPLNVHIYASVIIIWYLSVSSGYKIQLTGSIASRYWRWHYKQISAFLRNGYLTTHLNIETELTNPINLNIVSCRIGFGHTYRYTSKHRIYVTMDVNNVMFMETLNWTIINKMELHSMNSTNKPFFSVVVSFLYLYRWCMRVISDVLKENLSKCELLWQLIARLI